MYAVPAAGGVGGSCQQDALTKCTDPLKILTNNRDLGFAANEEELGVICPLVDLISFNILLTILIFLIFKFNSFNLCQFHSKFQI